MPANTLPLIDQAFTFPGDQSTANSSSYVLLPEFLRGHYIEIIVYALFSAGTSAGKLTVQTAPTFDYAGTWANVGATTIDWSAASKTGYLAITGVFGSMRIAITTTATGGTVSAYVVAASN